MASVQSPNKLRTELFVKSFDFDPNATTLTDIGWVDAQKFENFLFQFFRTIGTGALVMKVLANDASDGSGTDVVIATKTITAEPDAVGDQVFIEVTAEQIRAVCDAAGVAGRYVSANVSVATNTDEGVVTYIFKPGRFKYDGLTADIVA